MIISTSVHSESAIRGFTLVELAVALLVLGLIGLTLIGPVHTAFEQQERQRNQQRLDEIHEALLGYAVQNNRLPCPDCVGVGGSCLAADLNDFKEDVAGIGPGRSCKTDIGNLPAQDLGLSGKDVWGQNYTYAIGTAFKQEVLSGEPCTRPSGTWLGICTGGSISVTNMPAAGPHTCPPGSRPDAVVTVDQIAAIVVSQGKKPNDLNHLPVSCFEQQNMDSAGTAPPPTPPPRTFVSTDYSSHQDAGNPADEARNFYFDDMLIWISAHQLRSRMLAAGKLP